MTKTPEELHIISQKSDGKIHAVHRWASGHQILIFESLAAFEKTKKLLEIGSRPAHLTDPDKPSAAERREREKSFPKCACGNTLSLRIQQEGGTRCPPCQEAHDEVRKAFERESRRERIMQAIADRPPPEPTAYPNKAWCDAYVEWREWLMGEIEK
jgi:hypothetical protein